MNSCRQYEKNIVELSNDISVFQNLVGKLFEKEKELSSLKMELSRLEKQILHNLQQKASVPGQNLLQQSRASPVVQMDDYEPPQLLQKKLSGKTKGLKL